jgi:hypothetical protein
MGENYVQRSVLVDENPRSRSRWNRLHLLHEFCIGQANHHSPQLPVLAAAFTACPARECNLARAISLLLLSGPVALVFCSATVFVNRQVQNFINCLRVTDDQTLLERFQLIKKKPNLAEQNINLLTSFCRVSPVLALRVLVVFVN